MARGMAGRSPSAQQPTNSANVNPRTGRPYRFTLKQLEKKLAKGEQLGSKQMQRLQAAGRVAPSQQTPTPQLTPQQIESRVGTATGTGVEQFMNMISQQGAFQPGSYDQQIQNARQNVLNQFEATNAPEFARQQAQFNQMAAERGLDPNSVAYKTLQQQLTERQDAARQGAMMAAEQAADQRQQQIFGQQLQQYQVPATMLGALQPFYQQFGQRLTEAEKQELERQAMAQNAQLQREQIAAGVQQARIGTAGTLTFEQQLERDRLNNAAMAGLKMLPGAQKQSPSTGSSIVGGIAEGIGAGLGEYLT
jgi:hypothetical protein